MMVVVADFNADYPIASPSTDDENERKKARARKEHGSRVLRERAWKEQRGRRERKREWKEKEEEEGQKKKRERQNLRPEDEEWQRLILRALHREFPTGREVPPLVECRVTINIDDAPFFLRFFSRLFHGHSAIPSSTAIAEFILAARGGRGGERWINRAERSRKKRGLQEKTKENRAWNHTSAYSFTVLNGRQAVNRTKIS